MPLTTTQLPLYDWRIGQPPAANMPGLPPPVARLIAMRGLADVADPASLSDFLDAPLRTLVHPEAVPGVAEASRAIQDTMRAGGQIVVFGDFDCDGVTATAILTSMLRLLGASVLPFIPTRSEGYGLSDEAVSRCLDEASRASPNAPCRLLVTVDCGMGAGPALRRFLDAGYRVIVSDHHTPGDPLPPECTVVHTFDPAMPAPCRHLCGAGLAYKIACGVVTLLHPLPDRTGRAELHAWMAPLAVATVADVMPLTGENRAYVREGLNILNRRPGTGMKALIRKAFTDRAPARFTARDLGFIFGPHINAAGRLESCEPALRLLLAENDDEALGHATALAALNARRKTAENQILAELDTQLADQAVFNPETDGAAVLAGHGWHPGVVGLAAGRLAERLSRPVVVIAIGEDGDARGSARAPERGYNLHSALTACSSLLTRFGGHAAAAGLSLREADIPAFRRAFAEECRKQVGATHVRSELAIDGTLGAEDIGEPLVAALRRLEPFGSGNPEPCWLFEDVSVATSVIGKEKTHLRVRLTREDGLDIGGVWFGAARFAPLFAAGGRWDVAGEIVENEFRGDTEIEISVRDARPHN